MKLPDDVLGEIAQYTMMVKNHQWSVEGALKHIAEFALTRYVQSSADAKDAERYRFLRDQPPIFNRSGFFIGLKDESGRIVQATHDFADTQIDDTISSISSCRAYRPGENTDYCQNCGGTRAAHGDIGSSQT